LNLQAAYSEGQYLRRKEDSPEGESTDMYNVVALRNCSSVRASFLNVMVLHCN